MQRSRLRPHAEVHHEEDGWHLDVLDYDPVRGLMLVTTVIAATFTAAWVAFEAYRRVLGGGS